MEYQRSSAVKFIRFSEDEEPDIQPEAQSLFPKVDITAFKYKERSVEAVSISNIDVSCF